MEKFIPSILEDDMWELLLEFMVKFGFVSLILYGAFRGLSVNIINNIYGGKLAVIQAKKSNKESN